MDKTIHIQFPRRVIVLYGILAIILIPWIFNLAANLPTRHLVRRWDAIWVGFDVIMLVVLGLTVFFALKKLLWVALSATALATLFIVDAWFDILASRPGKEQRTAIFFGSLEIILAFFTLRLVYHVIRHSTPRQDNIELAAKDS
ncbi:hypothetical protein BVY00_02015 [bacterium G20]|nr:hypothetical protein BVY00_02015 [bacterium G20]